MTPRQSRTAEGWLSRRLMTRAITGVARITPAASAAFASDSRRSASAPDRIRDLPLPPLPPPPPPTACSSAASSACSGATHTNTSATLPSGRNSLSRSGSAASGTVVTFGSMSCRSCFATYSNSERSMWLSRSVSKSANSPCSLSRVQNCRPDSAATRVRSSTDSLNAGCLASSIERAVGRRDRGFATGCLSGEGATIAAAIAAAIADVRLPAASDAERGCSLIGLEGILAAAGL